MALLLSMRFFTQPRSGAVIPGLYAAGETVGMMYGTYVGATSVLRALVFGRIAGSHAAGVQ